MEVRQGDIFWIDIDEPKGSAPGFTRPFVVIQNNLFNKSKIQEMFCSLKMKQICQNKVLLLFRKC